MLDERLRRAGLVVTWDKSEDGDEGPWRSLLARKVSTQKATSMLSLSV